MVDPFNLNSEERLEEVLMDIAYGDIPRGWRYCVTQEIECLSRWKVHYYSIITNGEEFYKVSYSDGLTELQDDGITDLTIVPVRPREQTTIVYDEVID